MTEFKIYPYPVCMSVMRNTKGFTLIEVLIAAIILFSAIALTSEIFSASNTSSKKILSNSQYFQSSAIAITSIKSDVRFMFKEQPMQSNYQNELIVGGVKYTWQTTSFEPFSHFPDIANLQVPKAKYAKYLIAVEVDGFENKSFEFMVTLWP